MIRNIYRKYICSSIKIQVTCLLFFSLFFSYKSAAQNKINDEIKQYYTVISFGEKFDFGSIDASTSWTITNSENNINTTLRGNEINTYVFQEPGEYEINFQENKKDDEDSHPMFAEKFRIKVEPVRLSFDFSKIQFSEKIERGRNYSDLIISVPVNITTKDNSVTKLPAPGMSVSGVGVAFTVIPVENEIILNNKIQLLKYKVSGMVDKETYLMFDFYDFNNQVQTYNLSQIIK
jgi:hypothetical protein